MTVEDVARRVAASQPSADLGVIDKAYRFARLAHQGQHRRSGEEFIEHPLAVAGILADLGLDSITVAAGLMHDVVEDTGVELEQIRSEFGDEIAFLVDGVTKLSRLQFRDRAQEQAENLRKMLLAMGRDIRVILIKLADRLHNMRTLDSLDEARRRAIARETLDVFAPVAHRLGIFRIKWQLEDLSLRYLEPDAYRDLAERIPLKRAEREALANEIMTQLQQRLADVGLHAEVSGRAKHFYSIYRKMYDQGKDLSQIYDLVAVRVITETVKDCYGVLGIVHTLWRPLPGRFKDYIATPKSNMYQSLHTTVVGPKGEPIEIQIRTREMHRTAEYGIAAHWRYKESREARDGKDAAQKTDRDFDQRLAWLREVLDWQHEMQDPGEFMESLRLDIFSDEVFVFTPKGKVVQLPAGSTPIDFAYRIHTEIGHHCAGAKVNGRITQLDKPIENGDIVEILTSKAAAPSLDWLNIARTSNAKNRIRQWFKREHRDEALELGSVALEREARRQGLDPVAILKPEWLDEVRRRFSFQTTDDLVAAVGFGGSSAVQVIGRLRDIERREAPAARRTPPSRPSAGNRPDAVHIGGKGFDKLLVRFSRCCNPEPGEPIVGYVTRGRGVSIHHPDCPNLQAHRASGGGRLVEVSWEELSAPVYPVALEIHGLDRPGLLSDVTQIVAESHTNIIYALVRGRARNQNLAIIDLILEIADMQQVEHLRKKILKVKDVWTAERVARARQA